MTAYTIENNMYIVRRADKRHYAVTEAEAIAMYNGTRAEAIDGGLRIYGMVRDVGHPEATGNLFEEAIIYAEEAVLFNDEFTPRDPRVIAENNGQRYVSVSTWLHYMM